MAIYQMFDQLCAKHTVTVKDNIMYMFVRYCRARGVNPKCEIVKGKAVFTI